MKLVYCSYYLADNLLCLSIELGAYKLLELTYEFIV